MKEKRRRWPKRGKTKKKEKQGVVGQPTPLLGKKPRSEGKGGGGGGGGGFKTKHRKRFPGVNFKQDYLLKIGRTNSIKLRKKKKRARDVVKEEVVVQERRKPTQSNLIRRGRVSKEKSE